MAGGEGGHGEGMGRHSINGQTFEMERIDETVIAGTTEIWEFDNMMGDEIHYAHSGFIVRALRQGSATEPALN